MRTCALPLCRPSGCDVARLCSSFIRHWPRVALAAYCTSTLPCTRFPPFHRWLPFFLGRTPPTLKPQAPKPPNPQAPKPPNPQAPNTSIPCVWNPSLPPAPEPPAQPLDRSLPLGGFSAACTSRRSWTSTRGTWACPGACRRPEQAESAGQRVSGSGRRVGGGGGVGGVGGRAPGAVWHGWDGFCFFVFSGAPRNIPFEGFSVVGYTKQCLRLLVLPVLTFPSHSLPELIGRQSRDRWRLSPWNIWRLATQTDWGMSISHFLRLRD